MTSLSESRTEFLAADALGSSPSGIKYSRKGGVFVNTKKAIFLFLFVVACMAVVGLIVHFVEKDTRWMNKKEIITEDAAVETPGSTEASTGSYMKLRLPRHVIPVYYRLQLQPFLQSNDGQQNFTFKGHVSITVNCQNSTNIILLHAKELQLDQQVNISVATNHNFEKEENVISGASTVISTSPFTMMTSTLMESTETTPRESSNVTVDYHGASASPPGGRRKRRSPFHHRADRRRSVESTTTSPIDTHDEVPKVTALSTDTASNVVTLNLDRPLVAGSSYVLNIAFTGKLQDSLYGFYRSSYKDASGTLKWMAVTQFEPQAARQAFPCFDEPDMKAQFEISIGHKPGMTSISNMPRRSTTNGEDGWVWDHYEVSPIMSTYLVAYIVAPEDFTTTETIARTKPDIRVFARKDLSPYTAYATDVAPRMVQFYNEYFNISYPLPQMLIAAIPDFSAGAMENWGLITFREARVLFDPMASTTKDKDNVAMTVAHEIAHQWFGNLVTMKWWNDLWLNEGFASYMEYLGANYVEPTWGMLDKILLYDVHTAMTEDSLRSTHPVSVKADTPGQISEQFDKMSYSKGASLIRMLNHTLTESVFRAGIADYLNHWQYKNAAQDDLWEALTKACRRNPQVKTLPSNVTVKDVMDTWTLQKGYPVVTVTRDYTTRAALLSQMRFTLDNSTNNEEPQPLWTIPISYLTQDEMNAGNLSTMSKFWLRNTTGIIEGLPQDKWVVFNVYQTGYYRVNYDDRNWQLLSEYLEKAPVLLPAATRAQLLDDAFNLARAGLLGYDKALNVTRYLVTRENHYVPWNTALRNLGYIDRQLRRNKVYGEFQRYMRTILSNVNKSLGYEPKANEDQMQKLLRTDVLSWLSRLGDKPTIVWAQTLFHNWTASPDPDKQNPVPVDFRLTVYCTAVREGDAEEWNFVLKRYIAAVTRPSEAIVLLKALGCTRREWLVDRLLEMIVWESTVRQQDTIWAMRSIPGNPVASQLGFNYLLSNWDHVYKKFNKTPSMLRNVLKALIQGLTTEYDLKTLQEFQKANRDKLSYAERAMKQLSENLDLQVHWFKSHYSVVAQWLKSFNSK